MSTSPPKEICWRSNHLLQQTKQNKTENKTENKSKHAPRKMHSA
jgi:hypothetical protein